MYNFSILFAFVLMFVNAGCGTDDSSGAGNNDSSSTSTHNKRAGRNSNSGKSNKNTGSNGIINTNNDSDKGNDQMGEEERKRREKARKEFEEQERIEKLRSKLREPGASLQEVSKNDLETILFKEITGYHPEMVERIINDPRIDVSTIKVHGASLLFHAINKFVPFDQLPTGPTGKRLQETNMGSFSTTDEDRLKVFQLLLNTGKFDVNQKTDFGYTLLFWAAQFGSSKKGMVKELLKKPKIKIHEVVGEIKWPPLNMVAADGSLEDLKEFLSKKDLNINLGDIDDDNPLMQAAFRGREDIVQELVNDKRINLKHKNKKGESPLLWAKKGKEEFEKEHAEGGYKQKRLKEYDKVIRLLESKGVR